MSTSVPFKPEGSHTVTAYLRIKGAAEAIAFYEKAMGAEEVMRLSNPDGSLAHAQIKIGDSLVMLADEYPESNILGPKSLNGTTVAMHVYVEDVDAVFARVLEAGAEVIFPLADQFYGERSGRVRDPFGHEWLFSTQIEALTAEEMQRRFDDMMASSET